MQQIRKLPTLDELYSGNIEEFNNKQSIMFLLNQEPKKEWLEQHPMTRQLYVPIGRVEYLLNFLFPLWSVEVLNFQVLANSVGIHVRLHLDFPDGVKRFFDGVAAVPLQTAKGASATDFSALHSAAVQMALPSAKSYAIKDAADHVGKIFGRDINRKAIAQAAYEILPNEDKPEITEVQKLLLHDLDCAAQGISSTKELLVFYQEKIQTVENPLMLELFKNICSSRRKQIESIANGEY